MKFINNLQKFMYGRYGIDELSNFLLKIYLVLIIIDIFINSLALFIIETVLMILIIYRTLSKKTYLRLSENKKFLNLKKSLFSKKDGNYIYKKCHFCKTKLRLPLPEKKGIKYVKCPECKKRNKFLILRSEKIEIIKNKSS